MKKRITSQYLTLCFWLLVSLPLPLMAKDAPCAETISIGKVFSNQGEIALPSSKSIVKLMLDGQVSVKDTEDFFIRVLLADASGNDYLVYENYPEICNGSTESLVNIGLETSLLPNVLPTKIKIFVKNAALTVQSVNVDYNDQIYRVGSKEYLLKADSLKYQQAKETAEKINLYNENRGKTWSAGVTRLALMNYQQRKQVLGLPDGVSSQGIEYYVGGVFVLKNDTVSPKMAQVESEVVKSFDWRNRHGINWMTPVKDQGQSCYCSAFAAVSCVEALSNLYYNKKLDLDLSEQEAACCNEYVQSRDPYTGGMSIDAPLDYFRDHGVCDEEAYPFVDADSAHNCRSDEVTPNYTVRIKGYHQINSKAEDIIKKAIIAQGPLVSGFYFGYTWNGKKYVGNSHAMVLTGWHVLQAGDTIKHLHHKGDGTDLSVCKVILPGDSLIGSTVWTFKNSYQENGLDIMSPEYMYIVFENMRNMHYAQAIDYPIYVSNMSEGDIVSEDKDGDGYYNWGIGPKPASCPSWVPDEEDGDDSDPNYGPMDEYGHLQIITPDSCDAIHISQSGRIDGDVHFLRNVIIDPNIQWTVGGNLYFHNGAKLIVSNKASLKIVDNAVIDDVTLCVAKESSLDVQDGSEIRLRSGSNLFLPRGCSATLKDGTIKNMK